jgi:protein-disulfide isomerase
MKLSAIALTGILPALAFAADFDSSKTLGTVMAPVQIEVFSDFACPACRGFHETLLPMIVRDYVTPGKVVVVNREFPLNIPAHKFSRDAAAWATAAAKVGKYQAVSDKLFETQATWAVNGKVAETVLPLLPAADQKKVQALAKDPGVAQEVQRDVDAGFAARINETPTLIIKRGSKTYQFAGPSKENYILLKSLIDGLLK